MVSKRKTSIGVITEILLNSNKDSTENLDEVLKLKPLAQSKLCVYSFVLRFSHARILSYAV